MSAATAPQPRHVLVTGGAGYIGSHIANRLRRSGHEVTVLDNLSNGARAALEEGVNFMEADILDERALEQIFAEARPDLVIHCAALSDVEDSVIQPDAYFTTNTEGTRRLLEACARHGVNRFIFSSTAAVYGNSGAEPVTETAPCRPLHPYGESKLRAEALIADHAAARSGFRFMILRYFNVVGAAADGRNGLRSPSSALFPKAISAILSGQKNFTIHGDDHPTPDGTCVRDFIHVEDLVDAHLLGLAHLDAANASLTLNCGYGHGHSILAVLEHLRTLSGHEFDIIFGPRRANDPSVSVADSRELQNRLGWRPRFQDLEALCQSSWNWHRRRHSPSK